MDEEDFIETVRREASLESTDEANEVTAATLRTLGERVTEGAADDLVPHLPEPLAEPLTDVPGEAEPFSLEEFTDRVSDRADVDESHVVEYVRAVATALAEASTSAFEDAREQLPPEFDVLFEPGGPTTTDEFLETVRERAAADSRDEAAEATSATLRTLGERLTAGEAADLAHYLPETLAEELVGRGDERATDDTFDEFVRRVSQREGVEKADAEIHARAVGSTLAEAASEREVDAARKQLPDPFGVVFEPPDGSDRSDSNRTNG